MSILWKDDPAYLLNSANLHKISPDIFNFDSPFILEAGSNSIKIKAYTKFVINNNGVFKVYNVGASDITLTSADLDSGAFTLGTNYYVYICDVGTDQEVYKISANSTYPADYNANNSRKIGGFHYGRKRNSITVTDVTSSVIVPNSVWDLRHRPRCSPEGMVYLNNGVWVDIYLSSINEAIAFAAGSGSPLLTGTGKSSYNSIPLTGTEGLNGYNFIELARRSGKRLLTMQEWLQAAHHSPQGNNTNNVDAWSATTNNVRQTTGYVANAISLLNIVDCVGNISEWLDEFVIRQDGTLGWNNYNVMVGMGVGLPYMYSDVGFVQIIAGGPWSGGATAGSRYVSLYTNAWQVYSDCGTRFACDSL